MNLGKLKKWITTAGLRCTLSLQSNWKFQNSDLHSLNISIPVNFTKELYLHYYCMLQKSEIRETMKLFPKIITWAFLTLFFISVQANNRPRVDRNKIIFKSWYKDERNVVSRNLIKGVHSGNVDIRLSQSLLTLNGLNTKDSNICISLDFISGNSKSPQTSCH